MCIFCSTRALEPQWYWYHFGFSWMDKTSFICQPHQYISSQFCSLSLSLFYSSYKHLNFLKGWLGFLYVLNGICHFGQNICAFTLITFISPLTYAISNTCKRLFVIVSSGSCMLYQFGSDNSCPVFFTAVIWFGNSITLLNGIGVSLTLGGVMFYNQAKLAKQNRTLPNTSCQNQIHK